MHQSGVVARRLVEIDHIRLRGRARVDGKMRAAGQSLISPDIAKGVAVGERNALRNPQFDPIGHAATPRLPTALCGPS